MSISLFGFCHKIDVAWVTSYEPPTTPKLANGKRLWQEHARSTSRLDSTPRRGINKRPQEGLHRWAKVVGFDIRNGPGLFLFRSLSWRSMYEHRH